jgi:hypothetical protein
LEENVIESIELAICGHTLPFPKSLSNELPLVMKCPACQLKYVVEVQDDKKIAKQFTRPYPLRFLAVHY